VEVGALDCFQVYVRILTVPPHLGHRLCRMTMYEGQVEAREEAAFGAASSTSALHAVPVMPVACRLLSCHEREHLPGIIRSAGSKRRDATRLHFMLESLLVLAQ